LQSSGYGSQIIVWESRRLRSILRERVCFGIIAKIKAARKCIFSSTITWTSALADRVVDMEQGMFAADGKASDILCG
jgi:hypothetical protein